MTNHLLLVAISVILASVAGVMGAPISQTTILPQTTDSFNLTLSLASSRPKVLPPNFDLLNLIEYLKSSENAAAMITKQLLLNTFPNSQIDLIAPPAHVIYAKLPPPPDAKLISSLPIREVLQQVFHTSLGSYLVAVAEALRTEKQQEMQKFAISASKPGLQSASQALLDALNSTTKLMANMNYIVPKSATELQLSWIQFPVNTASGRLQNHVRQYSLAKGLQMTAATLRNFAQVNAAKFS